MKAFPLIDLIDKYGREIVANKVNCHVTNINHVISKNRKVYAVIDDKGEIDHCYEIKPFPNKNIADAKKSKKA